MHVPYWFHRIEFLHFVISKLTKNQCSQYKTKKIKYFFEFLYCFVCDILTTDYYVITILS